MCRRNEIPRYIFEQTVGVARAYKKFGNTSSPSDRTKLMKDLPKLGLVLAVLATGLVAALPFQREEPSGGTTAKASPKDLVLRRHVKLQIGPPNMDTQAAVGKRSGAPAKASKPAVIRSQTNEDRSPLPSPPPAPVLSDQFRRLDELPEAAGTNAAPAAELLATDTPIRRTGKPPGPSAAVATVMVRHRIADGDSLPELAQRYLGDRRLYLELFEFNRDVLASPDVLPIGQEIKVPFGAKQREP